MSAPDSRTQPVSPRPSSAEAVRGDGAGAPALGPRNDVVARQNPDLHAPPRTDHGSMPNLKWPFALSHTRQEEGGWSRETTTRELPASRSMAGVNMRLTAGGVRELHWHKASEWAYMLAGRARITAVDQHGGAFVDDVERGDLWFFPAGIPHSIQGLEPEGCEFLLVFDDGDFSENNTFLLSDWMAHTPREVLATNFGWPESAFDAAPREELFIFEAPLPGPLEGDRGMGAPAVAPRFSHKLLAQEPVRSPGGAVRIADTRNFPASTTTAAALVEIEPGGMRELHWHPNADEWQYWIEGEGRMTVFAASADARTFDFQAGDVGFVPFAMGHYIENMGSGRLSYLEIFPSDRYEDVSLAQWLALTPHELVHAHLGLERGLLEGLRREKMQVVRR
jgi:oxalate decarboxylase